MIGKVFCVTLFCLGLVSVDCAVKKIEDAAFLEDAASKYSPALVKSLILNRIEHKIGQIKVVSQSVGINEKQENLCTVMVKSFEVLKADIELMDETQVICGDNTYDKTIKGFINQFAMLTETFNQEYEFLMIPDITNNTPAALNNAITLTLYSTVDLIKKVTKGVQAFKDDIKADNKTQNNGLVQVLANAADHQLTLILDDLKVANNDVTVSLLVDRFWQIISVFYRQLGIINAKQTTPTTDAPSTQLPAILAN